MVSRPNMPNYAVNQLCKLFSLLIKIDWLEQDPISLEKPFQAPVLHLISCAKDEGLDSVSRQRRIATDLRDTQLLEILIISLDILKEALEKPLNDIQKACMVQALDLALACFNYDFVGTVNDETLDEAINIQVPTKWKPVILERRVVSLFFQLYIAVPIELVSTVFQVILQLASIRRMIFDTSERQRFVGMLVSGLELVLENNAKLSSDSDVFHQFCRIISRLKGNFQVSELTKSEEFSSLLNHLVAFTLESLRVPEILLQNSVYYLMSFWSKLAGSLLYSRTELEDIANKISPICIAFINSRLIIARITTNIARKSLIWIITMMASGINGKLSSHCQSDPEEDYLDGEIVSKVWRLMQQTDTHLEQQLSPTTDTQLELAYLYLLDEFRKAYMNDQVQQSSLIFEKLNQTLCIADESEALKLFTKKMYVSLLDNNFRIINLRFWGKHEKLLPATLNLLNDLTIGFANLRRLLKTDEIQLIFKEHSVIFLIFFKA